MSVYVGNFFVLGLDEAAVRDVGLRVLGVTHDAGMDTQEFYECHGDFSLLGLDFDSQGRMLPEVSRLWPGAAACRRISCRAWSGTLRA